ncbi:jg21130 [Pararge aegeria aegeria]|uniref:Jg21130 protein n=1 Tax=Pararge aegeria aegeria TaxID=348720 RepID=A0A8S4QPY1_9NEOP|nr:jg21130 [Pararge aegeria aegeria]
MGLYFESSFIKLRTYVRMTSKMLYAAAFQYKHDKSGASAAVTVRIAAGSMEAFIRAGGLSLDRGSPVPAIPRASAKWTGQTSRAWNADERGPLSTISALYRRLPKIKNYETPFAYRCFYNF